MDGDYWQTRTRLDGASAQWGVISEVMRRGFNVALPVVDSGDDFYVMRDRGGIYARVQVKSRKASWSVPRSSLRADFRVPVRQLRRPHHPELLYVFALRDEEGRSIGASVPSMTNFGTMSMSLGISAPVHYLLMTRRQLLRYLEGNPHVKWRGDEVSMGVKVTADSVTGGGKDMTRHWNAFGRYFRRGPLSQVGRLAA